MKRNIIEIDREKCIGCGLCANACEQGAIAMVDGKAQLVSENYCDGLGKCLPHCPVDAIHMVEKDVEFKPKKVEFVCPSTLATKITRKEKVEFTGEVGTELNQWPCQIKLVSPTAPFLENSDILIAADCCAFAYGDFHRDFMKDKVTIVGCPKLDDIDYSEKLAEIFTYNNINSVTVARMSVPCCGGLMNAVNKAIAKSGKDIKVDLSVISTDGRII